MWRRERLYLETLLRQFEYETDFLAVDGKTAVDTAWLRELLGITSHLADWRRLLVLGSH